MFDAIYGNCNLTVKNQCFVLVNTFNNKMQQCLCIQTGTLCRPKKFIHNTCDEFEITSDIPVEEIGNCDLLEKKLGGLMGCFFYPKDATIRFLGNCNDPKSKMKEMLSEWERECMAKTTIVRFHHLSVKATLPMEPEEEEEEEEDDDEYDRSDDDEDNSDENGDKEEWLSDDELPSGDCK